MDKAYDCSPLVNEMRELNANAHAAKKKEARRSMDGPFGMLYMKSVSEFANGLKKSSAGRRP